MISKPDHGTETFVVRKIGQSFPIARCKDDFNKVGFLFCEGWREFRINRTNGRFIAAFILGYFNVGVDEITDETSDTPSIEIGKCSPF